MTGKKNGIKISSKSLIIIVCVVAALFLVSSLVTFFSLKNLAVQVRKYNANLSDISGYVGQLNESLEERTAKLSSAELLQYFMTHVS